MMQNTGASGLSRRQPRKPHRIRLRITVLLMASGLVLLAAGAMLDIGHHAGAPGLAAEGFGAAGHQVTIAGMLLTAVAVALVAAFRQR
jgi:hypothetical protein